MRDVTVVEHETATLTCEPSRVNANVRWFKGDEEISTKDTRFKPVIDGKKLKLIITDAQLSDEGVFTCSIVDKITKATLAVEGTSCSLCFTIKQIMRQTILTEIDGQAHDIFEHVIHNLIKPYFYWH